VLTLGCLLVLPGALTRAQQEQESRYRSPRATVRTLLTSISLAGGRPERIQEAVACLDLGGLPAGQRTTAGLLARELEAVLRARDVDTGLIPDDTKEAVYVLPDGTGPRIALQRQADGRWLFDRETVAQIPKLYAQTQKQRQDQNREAASLKASPEHASPRATMRTFIEGYRRGDLERAIACLDLGDIPTVARHELGAQLANKLKQIMVRYRLPILQEIPDSSYSDPYVFLAQPDGVIELVRLTSGKRNGEWVFSRDTVRSIDQLYLDYEDKPYLDEVLALGSTVHLPQLWGEPELWLRSHMPSWLRTAVLRTSRLHIELYEALGYVLVPALAYGLYRLTTWLLAACLQWLLLRRGWTLPADSIRTRLRPTGRFAGVLFLRWGLLMLGPDRVVLVPLLAVLNPLVWILGMWAIFRWLDLFGDLMEVHLSTDRRRPEVTGMLWPVGSLAVKIALFVVTVFHLMTLFSWDVTAVLTGLGIGGLAFALGAQDSLKNLFGSFTLIADRPFVVGEVVKIGTHEPGVVEVVGLRSTRIRTTDDTLLIVPNSNLTTLEITNYGRRRYRRYVTRIGVAYATPPEKLIAFRDGIQELLRRHERTRKDHFEVAVSDLAASAIEILVNVYFEVADRHQELAARDALILDILRLAEQLCVELAFPTQTIHLVPPAGPAGQALAHEAGPAPAEPAARAQVNYAK
jgi:MscS family membrane protein